MSIRLLGRSLSASLLALAATLSLSAQDPDVPGFAQKAGLDKEEFLRRRDQHIARLRGLPHNLPYDPRVLAIQELRRQQAETEFIDPAFWTQIGPAPIPNGQTTTVSTPVSGRTISIAVHPTNPNIVYAGTAQGGVYRTLDGGTTWTAIFDGALSLAIGAVAIDPTNPTTLWVGTGEQSGSCDSFFGVGLYRVINADASPTLEGPFGGAEFSGRSIGKIVIHPTNSDMIWVASASGIGGIGCVAPPNPLPNRGLWRSTNATAVTPTFAQLTVMTANGGNRSVIDAVLDPGNPDVLLCTVLGFNVAGDGGIYRSANATQAVPTFSQTLTLGTATATHRAELAINRIAGTTRVWAATGEAPTVAPCTGAGHSGRLRRSDDGGLTWPTTLVAAEGFCGQQCFYDIAVAVPPADATTILVGGAANGSCSRVYVRSTNSGASFSGAGVADIGLHADTHALAIAPSNPSIVYVGSDGGIFKSIDGGATWVSLNNTGFHATQFQSLSQHPTDREFMIGGTQDNGTEFRNAGGAWTRADFGDGGHALIDRGSASTVTLNMYHTYFNQRGAGGLIGFARVSSTACATEGEWVFRGCGFTSGAIGCEGVPSAAANGINCLDSAVLFYAPIANGPGTPNTVYMGTDRLYRSVNRGDAMTVVSQQFAANVAVSAIGISDSDDNVRIVGLANGLVFRTMTGGNPLTNVTGVIPSRYIGRAMIDPSNDNHAYVTLVGYGLAAGQHVWKTTNLNAPAPVWVAAGTGIPDVPVNAFAIDPSQPLNLYAGTDIGVWASTDGGASWVPYSTGLPPVAVFDMAFQDGTPRVLRIATHGRGIWERTPLPVPVELFDVRVE